MSSSAQAVMATSDYWIRVNLTLEFCVKEALIDILHNHGKDPLYQGLPTDPVQLYQYMMIRKGDKEKYKVYHKILKPDQWALLCPSNGQSDSKEWDITLLVFVIKNEWKLLKTLLQYVVNARDLRNRLKHGSVDSISTLKEFDDQWDEIEKLLIGLKYKNMKQFHELKTTTLDKHNNEILKIVKDFLGELDSLKDEAADNTNKIKKLKSKIDVLGKYSSKIAVNMSILTKKVVKIEQNSTKTSG